MLFLLVKRVSGLIKLASNYVLDDTEFDDLDTSFSIVFKTLEIRMAALKGVQHHFLTSLPT